MKSAPRIHPSANVHPEAQIHPSCEIGPFCVVDKEVKLGPNNKLQSHVIIQNNTIVGEGNTFYPFSVIGAEPQDLKYKGEPTKLIIGNNNSIRECVTLNIGTEGGGGETRIGDSNLIMSYVHLGHDVIMGNNVILGNSCQVAGHVIIEDFAIVNGLTGVGQFIRIGAHCYVGGMSGLERDVPPFILGRGIADKFEVWGMNLVGLKRRGFDSEAISALQELNKLFFKDKSLEKEMALRKVEEVLGKHAPVQQFCQFIRGSKKGIYR